MLDRSAQVIAVAGGLERNANAEAPLQPRRQSSPVQPDVLATLLQALRHAADADIKPAASLGYVPAVAGKTILQKPQVAVAVAPLVGKFQFERHGLQRAHPGQRLSKQASMHRTGGAAGADQVAAAKLLIDDVVAAVAANVPDVMQQQPRAGLLQQPGIEFNPADRMLHAGDRQVQALQMPVQAAKAQETVRIAGRIQADIAHHFRRDPAGTQFEPGKDLLVEHQHIRPALLQAPGCRGAGRSAAHYDDVAGVHSEPLELQVEYRCWRVSAMWLFSRVVKTT